MPRVGKQVQGVSVSINKLNQHVTQTMHRHDLGTETITPGEGNQGGDGVQVSLMTRQ